MTVYLWDVTFNTIVCVRAIHKRFPVKTWINDCLINDWKEAYNISPAKKSATWWKVENSLVKFDFTVKYTVLENTTDTMNFFSIISTKAVDFDDFLTLMMTFFQ